MCDWLQKMAMMTMMLMWRDVVADFDNFVVAVVAERIDAYIDC